MSLLLKEIVEESPYIVFKGGTSLSKCYRLIERFSEDIDINFRAEVIPNNKAKEGLKDGIINAIHNAEMKLINGPDIRSRRNFNQYQVSYPLMVEPAGKLKEHLIVESYVFLKSFPYERKVVGNYILDYLRMEEQTNIIDKYGLKDFEINVQRLDRTLIDKIFAICDYFESSKVYQNSRHLYDIHMIWSNNKFDPKDFTKLFNQVTQERSQHKTNVSANTGYEILNTLNEIIQKNVYKNDYENITKFLLFEEMSYDNVIESLKDIVTSKVLPDKIKVVVEI